jgi:excisionase family DNA binding protein
LKDGLRSGQLTFRRVPRPVDAARVLGIHPQSLRRLIKQKKVPAHLFAGKYLIQRDKLEMFKSNYDPRPGRKPIRRLL